MYCAPPKQQVMVRFDNKQAVAPAVVADLCLKINRIAKIKKIIVSINNIQALVRHHLPAILL
jgi:hypothetical protein